jgi:hypothetical protein
MQQRKTSMRQFILAIAAMSGSLIVATSAQAKPISASHGPSLHGPSISHVASIGHYPSLHVPSSSKFIVNKNFNYFKCGIGSLNYSCYCWSKTYGCYQYWCPSRSCWFFYVPTYSCYLPCEYLSTVYVPVATTIIPLSAAVPLGVQSASVVAPAGPAGPVAPPGSGPIMAGSPPAP